MPSVERIARDRPFGPRSEFTGRLSVNECTRTDKETKSILTVLPTIVAPAALSMPTTAASTPGFESL